jgi:hypothetical protein
MSNLKNPSRSSRAGDDIAALESYVRWLPPGLATLETPGGSPAWLLAQCLVHLRAAAGIPSTLVVSDWDQLVEETVVVSELLLTTGRFDLARAAGEARAALEALRTAFDLQLPVVRSA